MNDCERIVNMVQNAIVGKDNTIIRVLLTILARGHVLLEDIPGVGKTTLALAFSKTLALDYSRMQFTPDVLPSDVTGFTVYNKATGALEYKPGAVLCNLFLADELNRATSRTQSALLEAMEEGQVTVDGVSHPIPKPFLVIATQNPVGASGTQLLPDSQMDRFMVRLSLGYPSAEHEVELLRRKQGMNLLEQISAVVTRERLEEMRAEVDQVHLAPEMMTYIVKIVSATRTHNSILQGASPRATLALAAMAKAFAYVQGRDYVIARDVPPVAVDTLSHRLLLQPAAENGTVTAQGLVQEIVRSTPAPRLA